MDAQTRITLLSGNEMPVIGLGTWQLNVNAAKTIEEAIRAGYRMIDTTADYGTQKSIGEAIKHCDVDRSDLFITTKIEEAEDAYEATRKNLHELQLDYANLVLIHRPPPFSAGEELWEGLIRAKEDGLAMDIGVSNYTIGQLEKLMDLTGEMPVVNQIEWTPFGHSLEMLEFCQSENIIIQAYSPLTRARRLNDATLTDLAAMYQKTPAQIILRWNIQLGVVPLPKANSMQHIKENLDVFDFEIDADDMATLNGLNEEYSSLSSLPYV